MRTLYSRLQALALAACLTVVTACGGGGADTIAEIDDDNPKAVAVTYLNAWKTDNTNQLAVLFGPGDAAESAELRSNGRKSQYYQDAFNDGSFIPEAVKSWDGTFHGIRDDSNAKLVRFAFHKYTSSGEDRYLTLNVDGDNDRFFVQMPGR